MAKQKKSIKGVTSRTRKGVVYWYVNVDGEKKYCGKGDKGYEMAVAAKSKSIADKFEKRELNAGLVVKRVKLKTVTDLSNWYMTLPKIQKQASFHRKTFSSGHLLEYFGHHPVFAVKADDIEEYREQRKAQELKEKLKGPNIFVKPEKKGDKNPGKGT